jgi:uncharacterized membrane protein
MVSEENKADVVVRLPEGSGAARLAAFVDSLVNQIARHWLALFNALIGIFLALPILAPVLMHLGLTGTGHLIYVAYSIVCHQLPERSYFLFGPQIVYTTHQLEALKAVPAGLDIYARMMLRWPGSPQLGYKIAFCERDTAIWGSILLGGLAFARLRAGSRALPKLPLWGYALLLVPMAIDGFTQLFGWRESNWQLRTITGTLFGLATIWLAYPYVQEAMEDVVRSGTATPGAVAS